MGAGGNESRPLFIMHDGGMRYAPSAFTHLDAVIILDAKNPSWPPLRWAVRKRYWNEGIRDFASNLGGLILRGIKPVVRVRLAKKPENELMFSLHC